MPLHFQSLSCLTVAVIPTRTSNEWTYRLVTTPRPVFDNEIVDTNSSVCTVSVILRYAPSSARAVSWIVVICLARNMPQICWKVINGQGKVIIYPLTPNDHYSGRTAPLTSKRCILYIYSTNISTEYFKHGIYSSFFSLQNAVCFIILTYLVPVLFTFCIQGVLK